MPGRETACRLQKLKGSDQVAFHVSARVFNRISYARLGSEMNDHLGAFLLENRPEKTRIFDFAEDIMKVIVAGLAVPASR